jgi:AraC-like DNA-binding protein
MNISGDFFEDVARGKFGSGCLGIGRLSAVYVGALPRCESAPSMAHRIVFDAAHGPRVIRSGEVSFDLNETALQGVAFLDPRRFASPDVECLQRKWQRLGDIGNRLDDLLDDVDTVRGRRLNTRLSDALGLLREGQTPRGVATALGVSETRLTRWFNAELGAPPKRWQVWMRLRRSVDLLLMGQSVMATSQEAGFADASHFSRACRTVFGLPPSVIARLNVRSSVSLSACTA